jgi:hypothetical protein
MDYDFFPASILCSEEFGFPNKTEASSGLPCRLDNRSQTCYEYFVLQNYRLTEPTKKNAGAAGFEPASGGSKGRCLTTWLRPNSSTF